MARADVSAHGGRGLSRPLFAFLAAALLLAPAMAQAADSPAVFHTAKGTFTFKLEIAETPKAREIGLMNRKSLAPDAGMLFDFQSDQNVAFWMENTLIPLDMVFIKSDGTVKTIHADAVPFDETPIPSGGAVQFVLEIPGGRAAEIGLAVGDKMQQSRVTPTPWTQSQAALLAGVLLLALAAFHAALALGAPWAAYAWGGENEGQLPTRLRRGSGLLSPVIAAMGVVLLMRGGWIFPDEAPGMLVPVWGVFVFLVLQTGGALRSTSAQEKRLMMPLYVVATAATAFVAFGHPG